MTGGPGHEPDAVPGEPSPGSGTPLRDIEQRWPVAGPARRTNGVFLTLRTDHVRMPDGEVVGRDVLEHPGAVAVVAIDEAGRVLLIRHYRHPAGHLLWEIPAGTLDVDGEHPRATAERELLEEAGYRASEWGVLADFYSSPGISSERIVVFLARGVTWVPEPDRGGHVPRHEEAHLLVRWIPLHEAVGHFLSGDFHNGVTAVGILSAYAAHQGGYEMLPEGDFPQP